MRPQLNEGRLRKLAEHLETGNLYHELFSILAISETVQVMKKGKLKKASCGCAMGEMPTVWPEVFRRYDGHVFWRRGHRPTKLKDEDESVFAMAEYWFGLDSALSTALFTVATQRRPLTFVTEMEFKYPGLLEQLHNQDAGVTRGEVAANIRRVLKYWKAKRWETVV